MPISEIVRAKDRRSGGHGMRASRGASTPRPKRRAKMIERSVRAASTSSSSGFAALVGLIDGPGRSASSHEAELSASHHSIRKKD